MRVQHEQEGAGPEAGPDDVGPDGPAQERDAAAARGLALRWAHLIALREARLARLDLPRPAPTRRVGTGAPVVPWGVELAASWAWRLLVIVAAGAVIAYVVSYLSVVVLPVVIALLITALAVPLVDLGSRWLPRSVAAVAVVVLGLAGVVALLVFAGQQVANGASDLADQTSAGLGQIRDWVEDGPLNASDSQINDYLTSAQEGIAGYAQDGLLGRVSEVGAAVGNVLAGIFIVLFATFFFMSDGSRIWSWVVRLAPRTARGQVDSSGRVAWISLTQFVRATVVVAAVDAIGIVVVAAVLQVPFVLAIGVLVFLGAFVPLIGATIAGSVAVLVALVDQGPFTALLMLGGVILVQQIEGQVLQPFLMGRWVSIHPLGIIVSLAIGILVAGIAGALVAVPFAAAVNAVAQHLAAHTVPGADADEELTEDYGEEHATVPATDAPTTAAPEPAEPPGPAADGTPEARP